MGRREEGHDPVRLAVVEAGQDDGVGDIQARIRHEATLPRLAHAARLSPNPRSSAADRGSGLSCDDGRDDSPPRTRATHRPDPHPPPRRSSRSRTGSRSSSGPDSSPMSPASRTASRGSSRFSTTTRPGTSTCTARPANATLRLLRDGRPVAVAGNAHRRTWSPRRRRRTTRPTTAAWSRTAAAAQIADVAEKRRVLDAMTERYFPGATRPRDYSPATDDDLARMELTDDRDRRSLGQDARRRPEGSARLGSRLPRIGLRSADLTVGRPQARPPGGRDRTWPGTRDGF